MKLLRTLAREEDGATMVEMTIVITLLLTLTLGFVDLGNAFYQWNAANKAVQAGARAASISSPVATALAGAADTTDPTLVGEAMASGAFIYSCTGSGSCSNGGTFSQTNFNAIFARMSAFFPRLQPANVRVTYTASGLGYWTRPGGPVPTITVSLEGLTFQFFFLGALLGFDDIAMPSMLSTVTGEDLKSTYP